MSTECEVSCTYAAMETHTCLFSVDSVWSRATGDSLPLEATGGQDVSFALSQYIQTFKDTVCQTNRHTHTHIEKEITREDDNEDDDRVLLWRVFLLTLDARIPARLHRGCVPAYSIFQLIQLGNE